MLKTPIAFQIFIFLIIILYPLLNLATIIMDIFIIAEYSQHLSFGFTLACQAALKTLISFYSLFLGVRCIKGKLDSIDDLKMFLILILFSPWIIKTPIFILNMITHKSIDLLTGFWINCVMAFLFFTIYFLYFSFSKKFLHYFQHKHKQIKGSSLSLTP